MPLLLCGSFAGGVLTALLLLCVFAAILANTAVPLSIVKPFACAAAGIGAAVSGLILAAGIGKMKLLCGLLCGGFYLLCLILATVANGHALALDGLNVTMLSVLLLGGTLGGAAAALRSN